MTSRHNRILLGFLIALLGLASQAQAATPPYATVFARVDGGLTLQNAIDVAPDGAIIILEPGIYRENLRIEKPITLIGTEGVFLEPADETFPAVSIFDTDEVIIQGVAIRMAQIGIDLSTGSCSIMDCLLSASVRGINASLLSGDSLDVSSSTIKSADRGVGILLRGQGDIRLTSCEFADLGTGLVVGGMVKVSAFKCIFERCFDGISTVDTASTVLVENRIRDNHGSGILFSPSPFAWEGGFLMLVRNSVVDNAGSGLSLCGVDGDTPGETFGQILGVDNIFSGNAISDFCPMDGLALPDGFTVP